MKWGVKPYKAIDSKKKKKKIKIYFFVGKKPLLFLVNVSISLFCFISVIDFLGK